MFVNIGGTADLICVADANPIIPDMFSWNWLVRNKHNHTNNFSFICLFFLLLFHFFSAFISGAVSMHRLTIFHSV